MSYRFISIVLIYLALTGFVNANDSSNKNFVFADDGLILNKTRQKINLIGNELYKKTSFNVYIAIRKNSLDKKIKTHIKLQSEKIENFYKNDSILISIALDTRKVELLTSRDMSNLIDKDTILDDYIVPFLAGYDKNDLISKYSAGMLNGYSETAESIAEKNNVILENAIYSESKDFFDGFRIFVYSVFFGIIFFFIYIKFKKYPKKEK